MSSLLLCAALSTVALAANPYAGATVPDDVASDARTTALAGMGIAGVAWTFDLVSELTKDQGTTPALPLGATSTLMTGVGIPVIAARNRSEHRRAGVDRQPLVGAVGWSIYGIHMFMATGCIIAGSLGGEPPDTLVLATGTMGLASMVAFAGDSVSLSRAGSARTGAVTPPAPTLALVPTVVPSRGYGGLSLVLTP